MLDATGELALPGSIKYNCLFAEHADNSLTANYQRLA